MTRARRPRSSWAGRALTPPPEGQLLPVRRLVSPLRGRHSGVGGWVQAGPAATRTPSQRPLCSYWLSAPNAAISGQDPGFSLWSSRLVCQSPVGAEGGCVSSLADVAPRHALLHHPTQASGHPSGPRPPGPPGGRGGLCLSDPGPPPHPAARPRSGPRRASPSGTACLSLRPAPCSGLTDQPPGARTPTPHDGPEPLGPAQLCDPRTASRTTRSRPAHPPPALRPDQAQGRPRDAFPGWRLCHSFTTKNHLLRFLLTLRDPDVSRGISARVLHHHPGAGAGGPDGGRGRHSPVDLLT